jgi:hypothetical protein
LFELYDGVGTCVETVLGIMPTADAIDLRAGVSTENMKELLSVAV